ncbi:MAG: nicotinamide-nucleotide amidohydrolase family protein [Deltaproteobacteria bacterium]|nr:nicotinamide-nucleotide amidohydrolase family protein [Deltaproteobacteria bacterium]
MKGPSGKNPGRVLGEALRERGLTLAVAESCTGGLLSAMITEMPGSSEYFIGGVVAYANDVKRKLLGVRAVTLKGRGAVSSAAAGEMAEGIRERLKADAGVSITGIAGPGGGSAKKPVGTVFIAVSYGGRTKVKKFLFEGGRKAVRRAAALAAMEETLLLLGAGKA